MALSACGASTPTPATPAATAATTATTTTTAAPARLGCNQYCQTAGGQFGPGPKVSAPARTTVRIVTAGTVTPSSDGLVPIMLTCDASSQCAGALVLTQTALGQPFPYQVVKSDLLIGPHGTRTFGLQVPSSVRNYVLSRGHRLPVTVAVYTGPISDGFYAHQNIVLAPAGSG